MRSFPLPTFPRWQNTSVPMLEKAIKILFSLVRREMKPKIYGIVLNYQKGNEQRSSLKVLMAYSLEDAIEICKERIKRDETGKDPVNIIVDPKPLLFVIHTPEELMEGFSNATFDEFVAKNIELQKLEPTKNDLLNDIIKNRDTIKYNEIKNMLTNEERQLVEAFLFR